MEVTTQAPSWQRETALVREVERAVDVLLTAHAANDLDRYLEAFAERSRIVLSSELTALPSRAAYAELLATRADVEACSRLLLDWAP